MADRPDEGHNFMKNHNAPNVFVMVLDSTADTAGIVTAVMDALSEWQRDREADSRARLIHD